MNVLMVGNHHSVKGGITSVVNQILMYNWSGDEDISIKYIPTYNDKSQIYKIITFIIGYIRIFVYLLFGKADVVHMHMSYKGSFTRKYFIHIMCRLFKKKDIIHLHGSEFEKFYLESNNRTKDRIHDLLKTCSAMIVLGDEWDRKIKGIEPKTNTVILCNSIKIPDEVVKFNNTQFNILFLGVLIKRKGVTDLIDAMKLLREKGILEEKNVKLYIAGTGKEEENLKSKTKLANLDKYIKFVGWVDSEKKVKLLKQCHLFVLPSYNEGLPIAILEAISYGIPVVSTKVGSINEAVVTGISGELVNTNDKEGLANAMNKLISSRTNWEDQSYNARKMAEDKFNEQKYFERLSKLYYKCVGRKK